MRGFSLLILAIFMTSSCHLQPLGPEARAGEKAEAPTKKSPDLGACGDEFQHASPQEKLQFLTQIKGLWRDDLGPTRQGKATGTAVQEGLLIQTPELSLARVHVRSESGSDTWLAVGPEPVVQADELSVGSADQDGFRILEARFGSKSQPGTYCLRYRMKSSLGDRPQLFIGGPRVSGANLPHGFEPHSLDRVRVFVR